MGQWTLGLKDHPQIVIIPQTAGILRATDAQARAVQTDKEWRVGGWRTCYCPCVCVCGDEGFMLCILSLSCLQLTLFNISQLTNGDAGSPVCVTLQRQQRHGNNYPPSLNITHSQTHTHATLGSPQCVWSPAYTQTMDTHGGVTSLLSHSTAHADTHIHTVMLTNSLTLN